MNIKLKISAIILLNEDNCLSNYSINIDACLMKHLNKEIPGTLLFRSFRFPAPTLCTTKWNKLSTLPGFDYADFINSLAGCNCRPAGSVFVNWANGFNNGRGVWDLH